MHIISVLATKGGAGKTTLATNLAVIASQKRGQKVLLIDIDPQGSAICWSDLRESAAPAVITTPVNRFKKILDGAKNDGVNTVIIDYPPHGDPNVAVAARLSDLLLVPCRPAAADLQAMAATIELVRFVKIPTLVVLNAVPSRGTLEVEAREALAGTGLDIAPDFIGDRIAFVRAYAAGMGVSEFDPKGKATKEVKKLYSYITKRL